MALCDTSNLEEGDSRVETQDSVCSISVSQIRHIVLEALSLVQTACDTHYNVHHPCIVTVAVVTIKN